MTYYVIFMDFFKDIFKDIMDIFKDIIQIDSIFLKCFYHILKNRCVRILVFMK